MKRYKLKKSVKRTLITILVIGVLIMSFIGMNNLHNNSMQKCINAGHSISYCENGLK